MTYDGTNVSGYVDNSIVVGPWSRTPGTATHPSEFTLGGEHNAPSFTPDLYKTHAIYDEVGFWNRALTTVELNDLYNNGNGQTMVGSLPPPPDSLQVVVGNSQVLLRWSRVLTFPPITSYQISVDVFNQQTQSFDFYGSTAVASDQNSVVLSVLDGGKTLQNGVLYRFTVAGVVSRG